MESVFDHYSPNPTSSSSTDHTMAGAARRCARRIERGCCTCATYTPLVFVYGLTSWAAWVDMSISSNPSKVSWLGTGSATGAFTIWLLLNWSYTTAVFTKPGSTTNDNGYAELPTEAPPQATSFTVKSNGELRFCKKCQARKPDRAHHCSSCRRCILKMDHHCPWLATCIGLRNHKAFLLFLIYTTLLCFYSFAVSGSWVYAEIVNDTKYVDNILPVNYIVLSVVSGIIGIVVGAFTGWHIMLASKGQTTIECLEKTRYLSPIRKQIRNHVPNINIPGVEMPKYGQQLIDAHANALPGITRPEEGEETRHFSYEDMERERAKRRYEEYLDEQDSEKLPNAFDLGWKGNLRHLFGPTAWLWAFPICNTIGNGWSWEPSPKWLAARERLATEREEQRNREINAGWGSTEPPPQFVRPSPPEGAGRHYLGGGSSGSQQQQQQQQHPSPSGSSGGSRIPSKADKILGRDPNLYADGPQETVSMRRLNQRGKTIEEELEMTDDEVDDERWLAQQTSGSFAVSAATSSSKEDEARAAENRAMNLVTNGGWGRGGASGLLRKDSRSPVGHAASRGPSSSSSSSLLQQGGRRHQDDDVLD